MKLPIRNTAGYYGLVSQLLHWAVVLGVVLQYSWAWRFHQTDSVRERLHLVNQHKSIGMTILGLMLVRIAWRLFNRPPPMPPVIHRWEASAARFTHGLLYTLLFAMPLTGWMHSSAVGYGAEFFGLLDIPDFVPVNETIELLAKTAHEWMAWVIPTVVIVHVGAALRHHFWLKDDVLKRMLPLWK